MTKRTIIQELETDAQLSEQDQRKLKGGARSTGEPGNPGDPFDPSASNDPLSEKGGTKGYGESSGESPSNF